MSQQKVWKGGGILRWARWCGNSPNWDRASALLAQTKPYASLWSLAQSKSRVILHFGDINGDWQEKSRRYFFLPFTPFVCGSVKLGRLNIRLASRLYNGRLWFGRLASGSQWRTKPDASNCWKLTENDFWLCVPVASFWFFLTCLWLIKRKKVHFLSLAELPSIFCSWSVPKKKNLAQTTKASGSDYIWATEHLHNVEC